MEIGSPYWPPIARKGHFIGELLAAAWRDVKQNNLAMNVRNLIKSF
jgi:hypothetical protein